MFYETLTDAIGWRRALHRCPQPAWLEFYATAFIAENSPIGDTGCKWVAGS